MTIKPFWDEIINPITMRKTELVDIRYTDPDKWRKIRKKSRASKDPITILYKKDLILVKFMNKIFGFIRYTDIGLFIGYGKPSTCKKETFTLLSEKDAIKIIISKIK